MVQFDSGQDKTATASLERRAKQSKNKSVVVKGFGRALIDSGKTERKGDESCSASR
jgi:hypothetical protein